MNSVFLTKSPDWTTIWLAARERLRRELGGATFDAWLAKLDLLEFGKDELQFGAPKPWVRNWVANNFVGRIERALRAEGGAPASITIVLGQAGLRVGGSAAQRKDDSVPSASVAVLPSPGSKEESGAAEEPPPFGRAAKPDQSFTSFVPGAANVLGFRSAQDFARGEMDDVSLLFIHGSFGYGKSHLLNATALESQRLGCRTLLLRSEDFMRLFLGALKSRDTLTFKEQVRAADMLIIDDVHHICRSTSTVSELLHTLNAYTDSRRRLVIAADRPPAGLENIGADLRSRFTGGLSIAIEKPDRATRLGILRARAEEYGRRTDAAVIPQDALERIADIEDATPRDIIGFFNTLKMHAQLATTQHAFRTAVEAIAMRGAVSPRVSIEDVQKKVAEYFEIDPREFRSNQRSRRVTRPRQVAMFLAREVTHRSLPEIGRRFGGRDHTTVLHACRRIVALCDQDANFKQEIDFLMRFLGKEN